MLFSRDDVAAYINNNFEPVWESVRAVPILRLDFGNGEVLTRTLNGNIASMVCSPDGDVLDILPGIYTPTGYMEQLHQLRLLANYVDQEGKEKRAPRCKEYHEKRLAAFQKNEVGPRFVNMADFSKRVIEGGLKAMLVEGKATPRPQPKEDTPIESREDVSAWKELVQDTEINEVVRRRQICELLLEQGLVQPTALTKRVYKEVLNADLDDPYLGLGKVLFKDYAFGKEDKK